MDAPGIHRVRSLRELLGLGRPPPPWGIRVAVDALERLSDAEKALRFVNQRAADSGWTLENRDEFEFITAHALLLELRRLQLQDVQRRLCNPVIPASEDEVRRLVHARLAAARARVDAIRRRPAAPKSSPTLPEIIDYSAYPSMPRPVFADPFDGDSSSSDSSSSHAGLPVADSSSSDSTSSSRSGLSVADSTSSRSGLSVADSTSSRARLPVAEPSSSRARLPVADPPSSRARLPGADSSSRAGLPVASPSAPRLRPLVADASSSRARALSADPSPLARALIAGTSPSATRAPTILENVLADSLGRPLVADPTSARDNAAPPLRVGNRSTPRAPEAAPRGVQDQAPRAQATPTSAAADASRFPGLLHAPGGARAAPTLKEARAIHLAARKLARRAERVTGFREITARLLGTLQGTLDGPVVVKDLYEDLVDLEETAPARLADYEAWNKAR
ncbi:hypothetical protein ACP70R_028590 [Stipagrostis hirtigluma subsp. patula]